MEEGREEEREREGEQGREGERERERGGREYLPSGKSFSSFLCKSTRCREVSSEKEEGSS